MNFLLLCTILASAILCASGATNLQVGNQELIQAINAALATYKSSNTLNSEVLKWYNSAAAASSDSCTATYPTTPTNGGALYSVVNSRVLNLCVVISQPNRFLNTTTNTYQGFDVDTVNYILTRLNAQYPASTSITVNNVQVSLANLLSSLGSGSCDMASGGLFITAARQLLNDFSCSITNAQYSALILAANSTTLNSLQALVNSNASIGATNGSSSYAYVAAAYPNLKLVDIASASDAIPLLRSGSIAGWVGPDLTINYFVGQNGDLAALTKFGTASTIGYAFRKDNSTGTTTTTTTTTTSKSSTTTSTSSSSSSSSSASTVVAAFGVVFIALIALLF